MYVAIKEVKPQKDYLLLLTFANGEIRQFDMKPYLDFGPFKELKNFSLFKTVRPSFDTVEWENEADLDPELLYQKSTRIE